MQVQAGAGGRRQADAVAVAAPTCCARMPGVTTRNWLRMCRILPLFRPRHTVRKLQAAGGVAAQEGAGRDSGAAVR